MPSWTPPAPQAVKTLLSFSFVLYRPHLREASDSSGGKRFSRVRSCIFPRGHPASSVECQPWALFVLSENLEAIFPPVPFGRSLASFLGEAQVWLGHSYPFPRSNVAFSCAPTCGMFLPQCWPVVRPEPRAKQRSSGYPGRDAGHCPSAVVEFALL